MGFISKLFGGNKEDKALQEALGQIRRILEDEQFQLDMLHPIMKAQIEAAPAYDRDPNGTGPFGFSETNPIPVNGPIGQLAYLSSWRPSGARESFFIGSVQWTRLMCSRLSRFQAVNGSCCLWIFIILGVRD